MTQGVAQPQANANATGVGFRERWKLCELASQRCHPFLRTFPVKTMTIHDMNGAKIR